MCNNCTGGNTLCSTCAGNSSLSSADHQRNTAALVQRLLTVQKGNYVEYADLNNLIHSRVNTVNNCPGESAGDLNDAIHTLRTKHKLVFHRISGFGVEHYAHLKVKVVTGSKAFRRINNIARIALEELATVRGNSNAQVKNIFTTDKSLLQVIQKATEKSSIVILRNLNQTNTLKSQQVMCKDIGTL